MGTVGVVVVLPIDVLAVGEAVMPLIEVRVLALATPCAIIDGGRRVASVRVRVTRRSPIIGDEVAAVPREVRTEVRRRTGRARTCWGSR